MYTVEFYSAIEEYIIMKFARKCMYLKNTNIAFEKQFFPYGDFSLKCLYLSYITRKQRYQVEWVEKRGMDLGRVCSDQSKHIVRNSQNITSLSLDCRSQIMTKRLLINYKILALA